MQKKCQEEERNKQIFLKMNRNYLNAQEDNMGKILTNKKKMKKMIKTIQNTIEMTLERCPTPPPISIKWVRFFKGSFF